GREIRRRRGHEAGRREKGDPDGRRPPPPGRLDPGAARRLRRVLVRLGAPGPAPLGLVSRRPGLPRHPGEEGQRKSAAARNGHRFVRLADRGPPEGGPALPLEGDRVRGGLPYFLRARVPAPWAPFWGALRPFARRLLLLQERGAPSRRRGDGLRRPA